MHGTLPLPCNGQPKGLEDEQYCNRHLVAARLQSLALICASKGWLNMGYENRKRGK
jgi:hypothetical protein